MAPGVCLLRAPNCTRVTRYASVLPPQKGAHSRPRACSENTKRSVSLAPLRAATRPWGMSSPTFLTLAFPNFRLGWHRRRHGRYAFDGAGNEDEDESNHARDGKDAGFARS